MKTNITRMIRQSMLLAMLCGICASPLFAEPNCVPGTKVHGKCTPPPPPPGTPNFPKRPANDPIIKPHQDPPKPEPKPAPKPEPKK